MGAMEKRHEEIIGGLYAELYGELLAYARAVLRDGSLAEEAVQECFRVACIKADELLACANRRGWLFLTLRNTCRHIQRNRGKLLRNLAQLAQAESGQPGRSDEQAPGFWYGDLANDPDFALLVKFAVEGYSLRELAEEYGLSLSAVKQRIYRAKLRFREKLAQK